MISIRQANFDKDKDVAEIRRTVFIDEQDVPEDLEWDDEDQSAIHILAYMDDKPVATARLLKSGRIGRMAVLKQYRQQGIGTAILEYLLDLALEQQCDKISLSSQVHAKQFYERMGFKVTSEIYQDAGIPHLDMVYDKAARKNGLINESRR